MGNFFAMDSGIAENLDPTGLSTGQGNRMSLGYRIYASSPTRKLYVNFQSIYFL